MPWARREQQTPGIKIRYREAPVAVLCSRSHRILNPHPAKHIHKHQRASFICGVVCGCVHRWSSKESHTQHNLKETNSHEAFCNTNLYYRSHYGTINRLLNVRCLSAPAPLHFIHVFTSTYKTFPVLYHSVGDLLVAFLIGGPRRELDFSSKNHNAWGPPFWCWNAMAQMNWF